MAERYHIIRNTFGRWIIVNARDPELAWSGSCWVEHEDGISRGRAQVSNFETMVFGGPCNEEMRRYTSREAAELGHKEMVSQIQLLASSGGK